MGAQTPATARNGCCNQLLEGTEHGREMWCFDFKFLFIVCCCHLITGQQQRQMGNFSMFLPHICIKLCITCAQAPEVQITELVVLVLLYKQLP